MINICYMYMVYKLIFMTTFLNELELIFYAVKCAQLAGAVEYTDYTSIEGQDSSPISVQDMTLNNLMVRLQS